MPSIRFLIKSSPKLINALTSLLIIPSFFGTHFPLGSQDHILVDTLSGLFGWPFPLCLTAERRGTQDSQWLPLTLRCPSEDPAQSTHGYTHSLFNGDSLSIHSALPFPAIPDSDSFQIQHGQNRTLSSLHSPNPVLPSRCSSRKLKNYP